jgi:hypothetical protein
MARWNSCLVPESLLFLILWLGLMGVGRTELFRDPGTFWHTEVGRRLLETGQFVRTDPFSFTRADQPWIAYHWLGDVTLAGVHGVLGWDGLLLLTSAALAGFYAWISGRLRQAGFHWLASWGLVALALAASVHNWHIRPHLATLFGLGVTYALLLDVDAGRSRPGRLLWLVPVFVLWSNVHGGVLGGLATLWLVLVGWLAVFLCRRSCPLGTKPQVLVVLAAGLACTAATVITPYGWESLRYWLHILSLDLGGIIQEHAPLAWVSPSGVAVLGLTALYGLALAGHYPQWPRWSWGVPAFWLWQAWERTRHAPLFAVVVLLVLAEILPSSRWPVWFSRRGSDLLAKPDGAELRWQGPAAVASLCLGVALLVQAAGWQIPVIGRGWVCLSADYWPADLADDLRWLEPASEQDRITGAVRILNDMLFGGYLIFHAPQVRVFIDDRCELYGQAFLEEYAQAERYQPQRLETWAEQWDIGYVLTRRGGSFDSYLRHRTDIWLVLSEGKSAVLFRRREKRD